MLKKRDIRTKFRFLQRKDCWGFLKTYRGVFIFPIILNKINYFIYLRNKAKKPKKLSQRLWKFRKHWALKRLLAKNELKKIRMKKTIETTRNQIKRRLAKHRHITLLLRKSKNRQHRLWVNRIKAPKNKFKIKRKYKKYWQTQRGIARKRRYFKFHWLRKPTIWNAMYPKFILNLISKRYSLKYKNHKKFYKPQLNKIFFQYLFKPNWWINFRHEKNILRLKLIMEPFKSKASAISKQNILPVNLWKTSYSQSFYLNIFHWDLKNLNKEKFIKINNKNILENIKIENNKWIQSLTNYNNFFNKKINYTWSINKWQIWSKPAIYWTPKSLNRWNINKNSQLFWWYKHWRRMNKFAKKNIFLTSNFNYNRRVSLVEPPFTRKWIKEIKSRKFKKKLKRKLRLERKKKSKKNWAWKRNFINKSSLLKHRWWKKLWHKSKYAIYWERRRYRKKKREMGFIEKKPSNYHIRTLFFYPRKKKYSQKKKQPAIKYLNYQTTKYLQLFYLLTTKKFQYTIKSYLNQKYNLFNSFFFYLESRLMTFLYRINLFCSMYFIRQLIQHHYITVNGNNITSPDFCLRNIKDVVSISFKSQKHKNYWLKQLTLNQKYIRSILVNYPKYIEINYRLLIAKFVRKPYKYELYFPNLVKKKNTPPYV